MLLDTKFYPSFLTRLRSFSIVLIFSSSAATSQTCKNACGTLPVKYPFGTGPGCGDPRFQTRVTCTNQQLTFVTHTGCYPITSIDYSNQILYVNDPSMSTCGCTQPSQGFSLDWDAPFSFHDDTVFALLGCDDVSSSSSPVVRPDGRNGSMSPACDSSQAGVQVCGLLDSCGAVSRVYVPVSTCCVYAPVDLGPAFEMDLWKLKCDGYSGFYGFEGHENDPQSWRYGIGIKYKFNFNDEYPPLCAHCEKTNGVCGYNVAYDSLVCNCPSGFNSTSDCAFEASWNISSRLLPWKIGALWLHGFMAWLLISMKT